MGMGWHCWNASYRLSSVFKVRERAEEKRFYLA
jgi:hypothetical protein